MQRPRRESVLTTILFTDIVHSSDLVAELGDRRWRILLSRHHALVRREVRRHGGKELDSAGDGFFVSFDNPGNAIRCAAAVVEGVQELGIEVRTGLHLGQAEIVGKKLGGLAVHIGARTMALAGPAEVLVTVGLRDVLPPFDFALEDRGAHVLKGVPGEWHLFRVTSVGRPLPQPLEPEVAAARRAAVQAPPLWRRRYVPVVGVVAVVAAGIVGAVLLFGTRAPPPTQPPRLAHRPAHALLRVDPRTGRIEATLALGNPEPPPPLGQGGGRYAGPGPRSIAAGEGSIWITNGGSDSVLRVDPISGRTKTIRVAGRPDAVTIGQGGVWVTSTDGHLTRIDPGTNQTTTTDISKSAPIPMDLAVGDKGAVYITSLACQVCPQAPIAPLAKVDISRGSVTDLGVPSHYPASSVIAVEGSLWMTAGSEVWQVRPVTGEVLRRIRIEEGLGELAVDEEGSSVWLTTVTAGGEVGWAYQIDTLSGRILGKQPVGCCPGSIAVGNGYVWVTNSIDGTIQRISQVTGDVLPPISVGKGVDGIVIGEGGVWVTVDS